jgi:hypothetical protein
VPHTKLHDAIADAVALAETAVERAIPGRSEAIVELLRAPEERDEVIWRRAFRAANNMGATVDADDWDLDLEELAEFPKEARDFQWCITWQAAISAAQAQVDSRSLLSLWEALEEGGTAVVEAARGVPRPLSPEARKGPGRVRFETAKQRRRGTNG